MRTANLRSLTDRRLYKIAHPQGRAEVYSGRVVRVVFIRSRDVSEIIKSEIISRRATFSLVLKAAAASLAVPAVLVLAAQEAEAQTQGQQRRDTRQGGRQDRRDQRRN